MRDCGRIPSGRRRRFDQVAGAQTGELRPPATADTRTSRCTAGRPRKHRGLHPTLRCWCRSPERPTRRIRKRRRRKRYAVLAGLDAEGFVPEDPQHIGFYWPGVSSSSSPASNVQLVAPPSGPLTVRLPASPPPSTAGPPLPKTVPFEWFKLRPERINAETTYQRILLLWFDEDVLAANASPAIAQSATAPSASRPRQAPLQQFAKLLCPYLPQRTGQPRPDKAKVKIFGPQLSTTLKAVVDEVNNWPTDGDWSVGNCPGSIPPPFYVSDATVSDATLIPDYVHKAGAASKMSRTRPVSPRTPASGISSRQRASNFIASSPRTRSARSHDQDRIGAAPYGSTKPAEQNMGDREVECGYHNAGGNHSTRTGAVPDRPEPPHCADLRVGYALRAGPAGHDGAMPGTARMRATQR